MVLYDFAAAAAVVAAAAADARRTRALIGAPFKRIPSKTEPKPTGLNEC